MKRTPFTVLSSLVVLCFAVSAWAAAPIKVDCNKEGSINKTLARLAQSGNTRGVTLSVTGTCNENITITGFDHLVLQGTPTATIQDASNGTAPVVSIGSSYDVTLRGFTINGGSQGVNCGGASVCSLNSNTIQQSAGLGVRIGRSTAFLTSNNILNNATQGIIVLNGGNLSTDSNTISNNGGVGIFVTDHGYLQAAGDTIQSNAVGIRAANNSDVRPIGVTVTNNHAEGVRLESGSTASFGNTGNVVSGNGGNGVSINDLSFASFGSADNVSGNLAQPDVACYPQYSATRGAGTVGGTTNCPN
jgi:hypothetical protein